MDDLGHNRLGSIRNKDNWNYANKRLFGSYSHSGIPGFPFRFLCSQEHNSLNMFRNIFLFRNIPNEHAPNYPLLREYFDGLLMLLYNNNIFFIIEIGYNVQCLTKMTGYRYSFLGNRLWICAIPDCPHVPKNQGSRTLTTLEQNLKCQYAMMFFRRKAKHPRHLIRDWTPGLPEH